MMLKNKIRIYKKKISLFIVLALLLVFCMFILDIAYSLLTYSNDPTHFMEKGFPFSFLGNITP